MTLRCRKRTTLGLRCGWATTITHDSKTGVMAAHQAEAHGQSLRERFLTWLRGPRDHRYICRECNQKWDLRAHEGNPGIYPGPYHYRERIVDASDGRRMVSLRCGPIAYEGRRIVS